MKWGWFLLILKCSFSCRLGTFSNFLSFGHVWDKSNSKFYSAMFLLSTEERKRQRKSKKGNEWKIIDYVKHGKALTSSYFNGNLMIRSQRVEWGSIKYSPAFRANGDRVNGDCEAQARRALVVIPFSLNFISILSRRYVPEGRPLEREKRKLLCKFEELASIGKADETLEINLRWILLFQIDGKQTAFKIRLGGAWTKWLWWRFEIDLKVWRLNWESFVRGCKLLIYYLNFSFVNLNAQKKLLNFITIFLIFLVTFLQFWDNNFIWWLLLLLYKSARQLCEI